MLNELNDIRRIKEGDIKVFESVFRLYYAPLCLYAGGITGSKDVAEEIVQDVFYAIWKNRDALHIFHSLKSYLYGSVRNRSLQFCESREIRERYKEAVLSGKKVHTPDPQDNMEYEELATLINRTLSRLPQRRVEIFRMHRFKGMKYHEIATVLSISVKTVEAEMTKTLKALRKEVEHYFKTT